jgi:hypothetical protein
MSLLEKTTPGKSEHAAMCFKWLDQIAGDPELDNPMAIKVGVLLRKYFNESKRHSWVSIDRLARDGAISRRTVQRSLKDLVELGHLSCVSSVGGSKDSTNHYWPIVGEVRPTRVSPDTRVTADTRVTRDADPCQLRPGPVSQLTPNTLTESMTSQLRHTKRQKAFCMSDVLGILEERSRLETTCTQEACRDAPGLLRLDPQFDRLPELFTKWVDWWSAVYVESRMFGTIEAQVCRHVFEYLDHTRYDGRPFSIEHCDISLMDHLYYNQQENIAELGEYDDGSDRWKRNLYAEMPTDPGFRLVPKPEGYDDRNG